MQFVLKCLGLALALCASFAAVAQGASDGRGSRDEAQALVKAIIEIHKTQGRAAAIALGNKPDGKFRAKDLYIFAYNMQGVNLVHVNPKFVGKNLSDMRDAVGKLVIQDMLKIAKSTEGRGWFEYKWPRYASKDVEPKASYVEVYDGVIYACGYYLEPGASPTRK